MTCSAHLSFQLYLYFTIYKLGCQIAGFVPMECNAVALNNYSAVNVMHTYIAICIHSRGNTKNKGTLKMININWFKKKNQGLQFSITFQIKNYLSYKLFYQSINYNFPRIRSMGFETPTSSFSLEKLILVFVTLSWFLRIGFYNRKATFL